MSRMHPTRRAGLVLAAAVLVAAFAAPLPGRAPKQTKKPHWLDLSLLVGPEYPCTWPTFPRFQINHYERIGLLSPYNSDLLFLDGNTGTQLDVPPHSVTPPDSGLANAGPFGLAFTDKIPAWQFVGEACVIDCTDLLDSAPNGRSDLIRKERVMAWEKRHRAVGPGDVVVFHSGYTDKYYKRLPEGRRFAAEPVAGTAPAWPGPDPDCMEYLASRKVMNLAIDSTSMGPLPDLAEPTHYAGLKHGMIWTESATRLGNLPATGAFYCMIGPKHARGAYAEGRAFALLPGTLAKRLIASARKKQVADLSVTLGEDLPCYWPGRGVGNQRQQYFTVRFGKNPNTKNTFDYHFIDSNTGTHLVPPAYALPGVDTKIAYSPEVQGWLREYEARYGLRGTSSLTAEKIPLTQTCGPARIIDVRHRLNTTTKEQWPASPEITVADIQRYEKESGALKAGDIVLFRSGWTDKYYKPLPDGSACFADPLNGKSEGWPAPGPDAIAYLADKGIRCVGTDAPALGGVDAKRALWTYWLLGTKGLAGIEFLTNLSSLPKDGYFLFAAVKIKNSHGCPGRAIGLY